MNQDQRIVIVGGGPAGLSTARAYREAGGRARVTLLAAEDFPPYRRPPLTKEFLRGEVRRPELPMEPGDWFEKNGVELKLGARATALDPDRRVVETENGEFPYDACVLATGSEPFRPPVPGADDPNVLVMRTIENSTALQQRVPSDGGTRAVVVGSGFIGCEAAASLSMRGAEVAMVSRSGIPQEDRLGEEVGRTINRWLEEHGVAVRHGVSLEGVSRQNGGFAVRVDDGDPYEADAVLLGVGVRPRLELAEEAGLKTEGAGVVCDAAMRTETPGVYAVGDIAYAYNPAAGRRLQVEHWGEALNHGAVAGTVLAGGEAAWDVAPGFWSTIGRRTLKYVAWGDGYDEARFVDHGDGSFTCRYGRDGVCVGVLTHGRDEDYERGRELVESGAPLP